MENTVYFFIKIYDFTQWNVYCSVNIYTRNLEKNSIIIN